MPPVRLACLLACLLGCLPVWTGHPLPAAIQGTERPPRPAGAAAANEPGARLAQPLFRGWHTSLAAARAAARAEGKLILAYATRTDGPCAACDAVERRVLAAPDFAALAADVVLFVHGPEAVAEGSAQAPAAPADAIPPAFAFLDADGRVQARLDAAAAAVSVLARAHEDTRACIEMADMLRTLPAEDAGRHAGELLAAEAALRKYRFVELDQRMQALGDRLTPAQRARIAPVHGELHCEWLLQQADMPARERAARFQKLCRDGARPAARLRVAYWTAFAAAGEAAADPVMIETALEALAGAEDLPAGWTETMQARARELRR
jgi:hypothetical protein